MVALPLVAGGVLAGRGIFSPTGHAASTTDIVADGPHRSPARPGGARHTTTDGAHTLAGLRAKLERLRRLNGTTEDTAAALERMPTPALRALALEVLPGVEAPLATVAERRACETTLAAALRELLRREGEEAFRWLGGMEKSPTTKLALDKLLSLAAREHPELTLEWLKRFEQDYGKTGYTRPTAESEMVQGAQKRGPDELLRVLRLLGDYRGNPLHGAEFPPDYDFQKVQAALPEYVGMSGFYTAWGALDRDAAWAAMKDSLLAGMTTTPGFGQLLLGAVNAQGEAAAVQWAVERLAELPPEQVQACMQTGIELGKLSASSLSTISHALPTEQRSHLAETIMRSTDDPVKMMPVLETLPRPELVRLMREAYPDVNPRLMDVLNSLGKDSQMKRFEKFKERFAFTPEEMEQITIPPGKYLR